MRGRIYGKRDLAACHSQSVLGLRQARLEHFEEIRQFDCVGAGAGRGSQGLKPLKTPVKSAQNQNGTAMLRRQFSRALSRYRSVLTSTGGPSELNLNVLGINLCLMEPLAGPS
jgi:hypothetical protein